MSELEKILAEDNLTVEGLLYRLLLAETQSMKTRALERRRAADDNRAAERPGPAADPRTSRARDAQDGPPLTR